MAAEMIPTIHEWAISFLTRPHEMLGRAGAVCPFTKPSLDRQMFWAGVDDAHYTTPDQLVGLMEGMADQFIELPGEAGKDAIFKVALVVLPNVTDYALIDRAHASLKDRFVSQGLMIGQFYPGCTVGGLWNPEFKPLDAPLPMLVIRHMVVTDFPFLVGSREWMDIFLRKFAPSIPSPVRAAMVQHLATAA
ncbi:hypothetical protein AVW09_00690 [Microbacterium sp. T32]|nr:hypothetical protein AVW09_00690 [Microbacterium sp. T32]